MFCSTVWLELADLHLSLAKLTPSEAEVQLRCKQRITGCLKPTRRSCSWPRPLPPCFLHWLGMFITLGRGQGGSRVSEGLVGCHPALWLVMLSRAWPQMQKPVKWDSVDSTGIVWVVLEARTFGKQADEERKQGASWMFNKKVIPGFLSAGTPSIYTYVLTSSDHH